MFHHDYNNSQSSNQHDELNEEDSFDLKLIESVKTHPVLYVKRKKKSYNLKITQAWDSISESTNKTVEEYQMRFKRLREYYSRERQRQKQGTTEIKYKFSNQMNFLAPYTCSRKPLRNITNSINLNDNIRATTITPPVTALKVNNNPDPLVGEKSSTEPRITNPTSDLVQKKNAA
uniref:MADF domain-containing protein n=1 Tax=Trichogramma kaykai TaxID=54128 RepID=A0ABD2W9C8_9HYME